MSTLEPKLEIKLSLDPAGARKGAGVVSKDMERMNKAAAIVAGKMTGASKAATSTSKSMSGAGKSASTAAKGMTSAGTGAASASKGMSSAAKSSTSAAKGMSSAGKSASSTAKGMQAAGSGANAASKGMNSASKSAASNSKGMNSAGNSASSYAKALNAAGKAADNTSSKMSRFGKNLSSMWRIAGGIILFNIIRKITRSIGDLIKAVENFDTEMHNVNSIAQLGGQEFEDLRDQVLDLALDPRIKDAPDVLAKGLYQITSAGFNTADSMVILKAASIAATAGLTTTDVAATAITATLNAYGKGAEDATKVSDTLFQIVNLGVLTFEQLASTIGTVLPSANALGVSIEELGAAYTVMTRQGLTADEATTELNAILTGLLKPTEDLTAGFIAHGYATGAVALEQLGFGGAVALTNQIIEEGTGNIGDYISNVRDMRGIQALTTDDMVGYNDALVDMDHASDGVGATQKALNEQMKATSFQIAVLRKNIKILAIVTLGLFARPLNYIIRQMSKFVVSLIRVARYVKEVVKGTHQIYKSFGAMGTGLMSTSTNITDAFKKVPGPLRGIAVGLGKAALSANMWITAMKDAFNSGKPVNELIKQFPPNLQSLAKKFLIVADSIGDLVARWKSDGFRAMLEDLQNELPLLLKNAFSFGVEVAVDITRWVLNSFPNVYNWLINTVQGKFGSGGKNFQPGRHGPSDKNPTIDEVLIDIAHFALGTIGGWAESAATNVQIWLDTNKMSGFTQAIKIDYLNPTFEDIQLGNYHKAVQDFITSDPINVTPTVDLNIQKAVENWVRAHADPTKLDFTDVRNIVLAGLALAFPVEGISLWFSTKILPDLVKVIRDVFVASFRGVFKGEDLELPIVGKVATTPSIWDNVKEAIIPDFSGWIKPDLPDWLDFKWLTDKINTASRDITTAANALRAAWQIMESVKNLFSPGDDKTDAPSPPPYGTPHSGGGAYPLAKPNDLGADSKLGKSSTISLILDLNRNSFDSKMAGAKRELEKFSKRKDESILDSDNSPALKSVFDSLVWGGVWDKSVFTSTLKADNQPALKSIFDGFTWGYEWGSMTFTASIDVDTSGLWNAVAQAYLAAAAISAVLPHSPAKKGPLKEPISFQYIADNMKESMAAAKMHAWAGAANINNALGSNSYISSQRMPTLPDVHAENRASTGTTIYQANIRVDGNAYSVDDLAVQLSPAIYKGLEEASQETRRARGVRK